MRVPSDMPESSKSPPERNPRRGRIIAAVVIAIVAVLALSMRAIATFWTDYLWFDDLERSSVWTSLLSAKVSLAVVATFVFFLIGWTNLLVAERLSPSFGSLSIQDEVLERYQAAVSGRQRLLLFLVALGVALVPGISAGGEWRTWILFRYGGSFGADDPQFGTDIGFYVFKLPFLSLVVDWLFLFLLVTLALVVALYYLNGSIRLQNADERITGSAKAHLSVLLALLALVKAADYWLQRFELTLQQRDSFDGAGYTAVNATLPALQLLILVALFAAVLFVINIRRRGWVLPAIAIALWFITSVVVAGIYPAFVQRFQVSPAELNREEPFIELNIDATRTALDIDDIESTNLEYDPELTVEEIQGQRANLELARLMDPAALGNRGGQDGTIQTLQFGRPYYRFRDIDVDRYVFGDQPAMVAGVSGTDAEEEAVEELGNEEEGSVTDEEVVETGEGPTPVIISTRELNLDGIPSPRTWEKEHLVFTHGYAGALAPANNANSRGEPNFLLGDIPAVTKNLPPLERPEIYVGEGMEGYAIVDTAQTELTQDDLEASYEGSTGVSIDSFFRKAAFSLRFGEIDPLISDLLNDESRVIYNRDAVERVQLLAPYLLLDPDPYPVLMDGGIKYVVDGYTTSGNYPYAESFNAQELDPEAVGETFNYVSNSVKALVDAYDGTVELYLTDTLYGSEDPIIRAYSEAFPDLYSETLPSGLLDHLRYPELLFKLQTTAWGRYHQASAATFFNNSDLWDIAQDPPSDASAQATTLTDANGVQTSDFARIDPYFQMIQLAPDRDPEFLLTRPFVLASQGDSARNLTAIMAVGNDPDNYGRLEEVIIQASGDTESGATTNRVDGTLQAAERISTDQQVSSYQTLVGDTGSSVEFGNLLILPFGDSLLYLRPVYARQESGGRNSLTRIAVTTGSEVGFGETVDDALADLVDGYEPPAQEGDEPTEPTGEGEPSEGDEPPQEPDRTTEEALAEADALFDEADAALVDGDLGEYQDKVSEARALLE
ncbi:MAG: UPF0182 family protein, partial [Microthrixaceae bacterium]